MIQLCHGHGADDTAMSSKAEKFDPADLGDIRSPTQETTNLEECPMIFKFKSSNAAYRQSCQPV